MLRLQIKVRSESLGERNRAAVLGSVQDTRGVFRVSSLGLSSELACFLGHRERFRKRIKTEHSRKNTNVNKIALASANLDKITGNVARVADIHFVTK